MIKTKLDLKNFKHLELFQDLTDETLDKLSKVMRVVNYPKKQIVFCDKDRLDEVYIGLSGKFSLYKLNDKGTKRIIFLFGKGILLNDHLRPDFPSAIHCESFEDAATLVCVKADFTRIMSEDFSLAQAVIDQYSSKLRRTYRQLKNTPMNISAPKKLAAKLYSLFRHYGVPTEDGILIDFPLTITHLSEMMGMPRETVSRAFAQLIKESLIEYEKKKIVIYNVNAIICFYREGPRDMACDRCAREHQNNCFFKE